MKGAPRSYSTADVAKRLGISLQTVQRWVDSGRLKAWKTPGGHRRIDAQSAESVFEAYRRAQGNVIDDIAAGEDAPSQQPITVVIVEDNPQDRALIVTLAQMALPHARLLVANNGFQGLVLIAKWAPHIVVTDIQMPHMDGIEMIRNVLADTATRPRLMVAVSARSADEMDVFGQLPSEVMLLHKPLDTDTFTQTLRQAG